MYLKTQHGYVGRINDTWVLGVSGQHAFSFCKQQALNVQQQLHQSFGDCCYLVNRKEEQ